MDDGKRYCKYGVGDGGRPEKQTRLFAVMEISWPVDKGFQGRK